MNLEQATTYLKKMGEWESVWRMDRDTILKWAEFLKNRETKSNDITDKKQTNRRPRRAAVIN